MTPNQQQDYHAAKTALVKKYPALAQLKPPQSTYLKFMLSRVVRNNDKAAMLRLLGPNGWALLQMALAQQAAKHPHLAKKNKRNFYRAMMT